MAAIRAPGRRAPLAAVAAPILALAIAGRAPAIVSPPEVGWRIDPGSGDGSEASQTAATGPIQQAAGNSLPGVASSGTASAAHGALAARTTTTVDAGQQDGSSFCFPIAPAPHCSAAEAWFADRLVFTAPGIPNGTPGSFTAQIAISGQLSATKPTTPDWTFVTVESDYTADVDVSGFGSERISASCIATGLAGFDCIPVALQILFPTATMKMPAGPFGVFQLGPYDFVWGTPFDLEVRLTANTSMNTEDQTSGQASADAALGSTLVWNGVVQLFDGTGGTGSPVAPGSAVVSPASGVDWLVTVPVPEPRRATLQLVALAALAAVVVGRRRARDPVG